MIWRRGKSSGLGFVLPFFRHTGKGRYPGSNDLIALETKPHVLICGCFRCFKMPTNLKISGAWMPVFTGMTVWLQCLC
jgi:hypothetical protein